MQAGLEARRLTKFYSGSPAIRDVSFTVSRGAILGLLGPNGSGKSTTVSIVTGLREPSMGEVWFDGVNVAEHFFAYKSRVGYVPEEAHLYPFLSAREFLDLIGRLRRLPPTLLMRKVDALLELLGLRAASDQPISAYSKGMKQKVLIIAALMHDPDLLILDEPESGLDVTAGIMLRRLVTILAARGKAIVYSSHLLENVERLCSEVVLLHRGAIVAQGAVNELRGMIAADASLEDVVTQLVTTIDPERTARDIADVASLRP
jgi:ABC-2 type transport system ATP-binding protein